MSLLKGFTKLMKGEPSRNKNPMNNSGWLIDESKCLSMAEVRKLNSVSQNQRRFGLKKTKFTKVRNWFMVELGLNAGLRVDEMTSLRHGDLIIKDSKSSINVIGKGDKKRSVWISSKFKKICSLYISYKEKFGFSISDESYLLNNLRGGRISKRALQKFFRKIREESGLPTRYRIHSLRHTYSTFLLIASNNNYRFVQRQLGHSSISVTQIYAGIVDSEARKALEKMYE